MSSSSVESDIAGKDGAGKEKIAVAGEEDVINSQEELEPTPEGGRIVELLQEEREAASTPVQNGFGGSGYKQVQEDTASENGSLQATIRGVGSPAESFVSGPDETPSIQVRP